MNHRFNTFLRIFIMLTLVVSPLRGLLASSLMPGSYSSSGMIHMQHEMPGSSGMSAMQADEVSSHNCNQCCDGDCCGQACASACTHSMPAVLAIDSAKITTLSDMLITYVISIYSERTVLPLLQPPISTLA